LGSLNKTLLILSGGKEAVEGILIAKKMGLRTIVCDGNENAPGKKYADEFIIGNIYDHDEMQNIISRYSKKDAINGVITIATDAVRTVAALSEQLKLPGITQKTARLSTDKFAMKKKFLKFAIQIPQFTDIENESDLIKKIQNFNEAILKPIDSRGARGVIRINKNSDLQWAYNYSLKFSPTKKLILEEWLPGPQISTESLVINGKTYLCGIADRNYSNLNETFPFIIENGGETPSKYYLKIKEKLEKILDNAAKALELKNGILKGDIVLKKNEPYIIETAVRLSGGFFSTITIPLVYHINLVEKAILLALGLKVNPPPSPLKHYFYQANRFFFPKPGIIKKISKPSKERIPKYVKFFELNAKVGDQVYPIESHPMRKGSVLVYGKTRKQAIQRVTKFINKIEILTE